MSWTDGKFPRCVTISSKLPAGPSPNCSKNRGHLNFNRPSDQLFARTPTAIVDADARTNASTNPLSKFRHSHSAHTPSLFFPTLSLSLPIASCKTQTLRPYFRVKPFAFTLFQTLCRCEKHQPVWNQANPNSFAKTLGVGCPSAAAPLRSRPVCSPFVFMVLQIAFPATHLF